MQKHFRIYHCYNIVPILRGKLPSPYSYGHVSTKFPFKSNTRQRTLPFPSASTFIILSRSHAKVAVTNSLMCS